MNKLILNGAIFRSMRSGIVACKECERTVCNIKSGVKSFKLVFICRCGMMGKAELNSPKKLFKAGGTAILKNGSLYCPICGAELASLNRDATINFSFRIRCGCGALYDKYKEFSQNNLRLKEYVK